MELERIDRDDPRRPPTPIEDDTATAADDDFAHEFYRPYTPHRNGRPNIFLANGEMPTASQAQASRRAAQAQQAGQRTPATGLSSRNGLRSASTPVATPGSTRPSTTTPSSNVVLLLGTEQVPQQHVLSHDEMQKLPENVPSHILKSGNSVGEGQMNVEGYESSRSRADNTKQSS